jgi:hypothetical protein
MDIKIIKEEKCIILMCYFSDSWDSLFMAIESNLTTLTLEDMVAPLLLDEMSELEEHGRIDQGCLGGERSIGLHR